MEKLTVSNVTFDTNCELSIITEVLELKPLLNKCQKYDYVTFSDNIIVLKEIKTFYLHTMPFGIKSYARKLSLSCNMRFKMGSYSEYVTDLVVYHKSCIEIGEDHCLESITYREVNYEQHRIVASLINKPKKIVAKSDLCFCELHA